jgi:NAD(P)-dependent dehydrogenase (short-subunit alcohol dehydrogenase family)
MSVLDMFSLEGKVAVVLGGGGALGSAIARGFGAVGATVAVTDLLQDRADAVAGEIADAGSAAKGYQMDVFEEGSLQACCDAVCSAFGKVDILVNAVGASPKEAATSPEQSFFDIALEATQHIIDLDFTRGVMVPCQVFGAKMKDNEDGGSIINISSMCAIRPLTRVCGYNAAKAAVSNFTQWLGVHFVLEYGPKLRVNAIAPGFFLTKLNRHLLTDEKTGGLSQRGQTIIDHTPMGTFGDAEDLVGTALWLASDASRFVTGIVVPVDGGFSAFGGV